MLLVPISLWMMLFDDDNEADSDIGIITINSNVNTSGSIISNTKTIIITSIKSVRTIVNRWQNLA